MDESVVRVAVPTPPTVFSLTFVPAPPTSLCNVPGLCNQKARSLIAFDPAALPSNSYVYVYLTVRREIKRERERERERDLQLQPLISSIPPVEKSRRLASHLPLLEDSREYPRAFAPEKIIICQVTRILGSTVPSPLRPSRNETKN